MIFGVAARNYFQLTTFDELLQREGVYRLKQPVGGADAASVAGRGFPRREGRLPPVFFCRSLGLSAGLVAGNALGETTLAASHFPPYAVGYAAPGGAALGRGHEGR